MQLGQRHFCKVAMVVLAALYFTSCQGTSDGSGSSEPLNDAEKIEYDRELIRCLKSGGTRIVKVLNRLRCY